MRILAGEWTSMEVDIVPVEEVLWDVGGLVRVAWVFGIPSYVDSSKSDLSSVGVSKLAILDCESQGRHGVRRKGKVAKGGMFLGAVSLL